MANGKDEAGRPQPKRLAVWAGTAALMLVPVLAIRVNDPGAWEVGDLVFLFILLAGVAAAFELAVRVPDRRAFAAGCGLALVTGLVSSWINLAVGIIGSEDDPANLMYAAVIAIALIGALTARFRPLGMALAMIAAAIAQVLTFVAALALGLGFTGPITVFFSALWLISAWLFRRSADQPRVFLA